MHKLTPNYILDKVHNSAHRGHFDAVVLFVDTSGFTPLTAYLTEQGRAGAETLADILQTVFEPLVDAVYAHGGFIAGFAGDAFKAIFPDLTDRSYLNAFAAAQRIRSHMAVNHSHNTMYGTFEFSVRLCMADGEVTWAIWTSNDEHVYPNSGYTFAGSAIGAAIQGEDYADGGELVATKSVYEALRGSSPNLLTGDQLEGEAEGYFSISYSQSVQPPLHSIPEHETSLDQYASHFYPSDLLTTQVRGEFRPVYTLFVNTQRLPNPGENDDFLPAFFRLLHQYGGYLCRVGQIGASDPGGTFLLFWGAPTSHENDLERVLSFVLALHRQIEMPLRAGITHSIVYAGFIGSKRREEYTCHGSSVNQAARQMTTAEWGQILLDVDTSRLAQDAFEVSLAGHYKLKGLANEQSLFSLISHRVHGEELFYTSDFIGRRNELSYLHRAIQPIFSGEFGGITLVSGDAGIGKSRLVHEFLTAIEEQNSIQLFVCQTDEILRESLNPFRYFLHRYFKQSATAGKAANRKCFDQILSSLILESANPALSKEIERTQSCLGALVNLHWVDSLYAQLEPQLRHENTLAALKSLIKVESLKQPIVLLLEDGHWLDADSLLFLENLVSNVDEFPFAILITARLQEDEAPVKLPADLIKQHIIVEALDEADIATLASTYLGASASDSVVQLLARRAEGNPFFAEQMLLYLQEQELLVYQKAGITDEADATWRLIDAVTDVERMLPTNLQTVLIARLDTLAQEVKQVVQTAAVLGREFSVRVLSLMLRNEETLDDMVDTAAAAAVWNSISELRYLFRHALLRDAAYEMQLRVQLRSLHRIAAHSIENLYADNLPSYYADLVYHYKMADEVDEERRYAWLAGLRAEEQFDNLAAVAYFSRTLALTPTTDLFERYEIERKRTKLYHILGERNQQEQCLAELERLTNQLKNNQTIAQVALDKAEFAMAISDYNAMISAAQQAIESGEDSTMLADGFIAWGNALSWQGEYSAAEAQLEQALALVQNSANKQEADAYNYLALVAMYRGDYVQCQQYQAQALPLYRQLDKPIDQGYSLNLIGLSIRHQGDSTRAMEYIRDALSVWQQVGYRRGILIANGNLGHGHLDRGDYRAAQRNYEYVGQIARDIQDTYHIATSLHNIGHVIWHMGDYPTASQYYQDALEIRRSLGAQGPMALVMRHMGDLLSIMGDLESGLAYCQESLAIAKEIKASADEGMALQKLGKVLFRMDNLAEAQSAYERSVELLGEQPQNQVESMAGLIEIAIAQQEVDRHKPLLEEILINVDESPVGINEPIYVFLVCYHALAALMDSRANDLLARAHKLLEERSSFIDDERLRRLYRQNIHANREVLSLIEN